MAISWGAYSEEIQLGIQWVQSPATVTSATASVTLTPEVWFRARYAYRHTMVFQLSGALSSTFTARVESVNGSTTTKKLWTGSPITVATSFAGTVTRSLSVTSQGVFFDGAKPSATGSHTVAQRPPSSLAAPASASASYVSDSRVDLTWGAVAGASNIVVQRAPFGTSSWIDITSSIPGTATSWSDPSVTANGRWRWRIAGANASGVGAFLETNAVATTPAAPTSVSLQRVGNDVLVDFTDMSPFNTHFEIERNGVVVGTITNEAARPWLDAGVDKFVGHRYRVRATISGDARVSALSSAALLNPVISPAIPSSLSPNGTVVPSDGGTNVNVRWQHNPLDSTAQTKYQIRRRYRPLGQEWGAWSASAEIVSTTPVAAVLRQLGDVEWDVRTWGEHADPSGYSAVASFTVAARPTVTITGPAQIQGPTATLTWTTHSASGSPVTAWEAEALIGGTRVASGSGTTGTSWTTPTVFGDGAAATLRVRVRDGNGLWSDWTTIARTVTYAPPSTPHLSALWEPEFGHVLVTAEATETPGMPETTSMIVQRSVAGEAWTTIGDTLSVAVIDNEAPLSGSLRYRVIAQSALPSSVEVVADVTSPHDSGDHSGCGVWLNAGPGFTASLRLEWDVTRRIRAGRDRLEKWYSGRSQPVQHDTTRLPLTIAASGALLPKGSRVPDITPAQLIAFAELPGSFLYRDPDGLTVYVSPFAGIDYEPSTVSEVGSISAALTRTARGTDAQRASMDAFAAPFIAEIAHGTYIITGGTTTETEPGVFEVSFP